MTQEEAEELDSIAEKYHDALIKLKRQIELNASLMCEVKRLETRVKELERQVRQVTVL